MLLPNLPKSMTFLTKKLKPLQTKFSQIVYVYLSRQFKFIEMAGNNFFNKLSVELFELIDITHTKTYPAHPQCNSHVEGF